MTNLFPQLPVSEVAAVGEQVEEGEPRLLTPNRRQLQVRVEDLEALLAPDHRARMIGAVVERLDLSVPRQITGGRRRGDAFGLGRLPPPRTVGGL